MWNSRFLKREYPPRISMASDFTWLELVTDRMAWIVVASLPMALQAQDNGILDCVGSPICFLFDVMDIDVAASKSVADAAASA